MADEKDIPQPPTVDPAKKPEESTPEVDSQTLVEAANKAAERLEAANKESERLIAIQQKAEVEKTVSGETTAGVQTMTKDERDIANAKEYLKGTGLEKEAFPEQTEN